MKHAQSVSKDQNSTTSNGSGDLYAFDDEMESPASVSSSPPETASGAAKKKPAGNSSKAIRRLVGATVIVGLLVAGAFAFPGIRDKFFGSKNTNPNLVFETVRKGKLRVSVTERGTLGSLNNSTMHCRVEGKTTIIFIVPEGTQVSKPVPAIVTGTVSKIQSSGKNQNVTVEGEPVLVNTPWVSLFLQGHTVEHHVPVGDHTKVLAKLHSRIEAGGFIAGDIVCELDSAGLVEKEKQLQIAVTKAEADVEKGNKNVEIQLNQNQSDLAAAKLKLDLARLDLKAFVEGDKIREENELKGNVLIAQEELAQADETYRYFQRIAKKGYKSQVELETARVAVVKAKNKLAVAEEKLKVLLKYTNERNYKEKKENAEESGRELERVALSGLAALAQYRAELKSRKLTYSVETEKLVRLRDQIKACKLMAPSGGKVIYARQRSRRSEAVVIEKGVEVYQRQAIISLPDFTQMKVEAKIHESKIGGVETNLDVSVKVDAVKDTVFKGIVQAVPDVPVKGEWPNTDMMLYETTVRILGDVGDLKPGMNAEVEIIVEDRDDVLQIPVQALLSIGETYAAYVETSEGVVLRKNIKIGSSNSKMVEIVSGLEEGEQVVMNPKSQKKLAAEINDLRADAEQELSKSGSKRKRPRRGKSGPGKKAGGKKKPGKKSSGKPDFAKIFNGLDKNNDGKLTKDEASAKMKPYFDRLDSNKDGSVDLGEYQKAMSKFMSGSGGSS